MLSELLLANCPVPLLLRRSTPTRDTVFGALSRESTTKSRCCTFYKNTSESTSLCKLDTDSSPPPSRALLLPPPSTAIGPGAHVSACPRPGWLSPLREGRGWRAPSLWTVPPSFTFQAGGLPLLGCSSRSSPPAWLLMLFFAATPSILGINGQWSVSRG